MARPKRHYSDQDRAAALAVYDAEPEGKARSIRAAKTAGGRGLIKNRTAGRRIMKS